MTERLKSKNASWTDMDYELTNEGLVHCAEGFIAEVIRPIDPSFTAEMVDRANAAPRLWAALEVARRMVEDEIPIKPTYEIERQQTLAAIDEALHPWWQEQLAARAQEKEDPE